MGQHKEDKNYIFNTMAYYIMLHILHIMQVQYNQIRVISIFKFTETQFSFNEELIDRCVFYLTSCMIFII